MLKGVPVHKLVGEEWKYFDSNRRWLINPEVTLTLRVGTTFQLNSEDTYMAIFSRAQKDHLDFFLKNFKGKIIYISPEATNNKPWHEDSRNTLVIFEKE